MYWGRDKVHLSPVGYLKMAERVVKMATDEELISKEANTGDNRKRWIADNDCTAARRPSPGRDGRDKKRVKYRGGSSDSYAWGSRGGGPGSWQRGGRMHRGMPY